MSLSRELLVPEGQVNEILGVKVAPREVGVNITVLNALGDRWLNRRDVLRYLDANIRSTDSKVLERLRRELADVTEGTH